MNYDNKHLLREEEPLLIFLTFPINPKNSQKNQSHEWIFTGESDFGQIRSSSEYPFGMSVVDADHQMKVF